MLLKHQLGFNSKYGKLLIEGLGNFQVICLGSSCTVCAQKGNTSSSFLVEPENNQEALLLVKVVSSNPKTKQSCNSFHVVHIIWQDKKPFVNNESNFITGSLGRPWYIDEKGFLYVYVLSKTYTNNPDEEDVFFVHDIDVMLKYLIDKVGDNELAVAATKTAEKATLQKKHAKLEAEVKKLRKIQARYEQFCVYAAQTIDGDNNGTLNIPNNSISTVINLYANLLTNQESFLDLLKDTLRNLKKAKGSVGPTLLENLSQAIGTRSINNKHETALSEIIRCHTELVKKRNTWKELARNLRRAVRIHWIGFRRLGTKRRAVKDAVDAIPSA